jgi:transcriptional regulator with XRE-family HTH domain
MHDPRAYPLVPEEIISPEPLSVPALKGSLGLTIEEFAAATGRSPRSAARWLAAESAQPETGEAARALRRLAHLEFLLADVIGPQRGSEWLRTPNRGFRGEAPLDLITSGRAEDVISVLELLADGTPA